MIDTNKIINNIIGGTINKKVKQSSINENHLYQKYIDEINNEIQHSVHNIKNEFSMLVVDNAINFIVNLCKTKRKKINYNIHLNKNIFRDEQEVQKLINERDNINGFLLWIKKDKNKFSFLINGENYYDKSNTER